VAQLSDQLYVHLGDEYDRGLRAALLTALLEAGATLKDLWSGVAGSQDVSHEEWIPPTASWWSRPRPMSACRSRGRKRR